MREVQQCNTIGHCHDARGIIQRCSTIGQCHEQAGRSSLHCSFRTLKYIECTVLVRERTLFRKQERVSYNKSYRHTHSKSPQPRPLCESGITIGYYDYSESIITINSYLVLVLSIAWASQNLEPLPVVTYQDSSSLWMVFFCVNLAPSQRGRCSPAADSWRADPRNDPRPAP